MGRGPLCIVWFNCSSSLSVHGISYILFISVLASRQQPIIQEKSGDRQRGGFQRPESSGDSAGSSPGFSACTRVQRLHPGSAEPRGADGRGSARPLVDSRGTAESRRRGRQRAERTRVPTWSSWGHHEDPRCPAVGELPEILAI
jgi:hypothetical protein